MGEPGETFTTDVPARLDRLPFSRFHWLALATLGGALLLGGAAATLTFAPSPAVLRGMRLSSSAAGWCAVAFGLGAVGGALGFGRAADLRGRCGPLQIALGVCVVVSLLNATAWDMTSLLLLRLLLGCGVGGAACVAIAALEELVPARRRGYAILALGAPFWIGASLAALTPQSDWRFAFLALAALAAGVLVLSRRLPESPRWMIASGRGDEAGVLVTSIERGIEKHRALPALFAPLPKVRLATREPAGWRDAVAALARRNGRRGALALLLVGAAAFACDTIFFSFTPLLTRRCGVPPSEVSGFLPVFAVAALAGPLLLGRPFDGLGRKPMTAGVSAVAGILLCLNGWLCGRSGLTAPALVLAWSSSLIFISTAAAAAGLTATEWAPTELRATAVALAVSVGFAAGGLVGPGLFGALFGDGAPAQVFAAYGLAGALMLLGAAADLLLGVRAERRPLEELARPLAWAGPDLASWPDEAGRPQAEPAHAVLNG